MIKLIEIEKLCANQEFMGKTMKTNKAIQPKTYQTQKTLLTCRATIRCIIFHNCKITILYSQKSYFSQSHCKIMVKYYNWLYPALFEFGFVYFTMMLLFFYLSMRRKMLEKIWGHSWPPMILYHKNMMGFNELPLCFSLDTFFMVHIKPYIIFLSDSSLLYYSIELDICHPPLNASLRLLNSQFLHHVVSLFKLQVSICFQKSCAISEVDVEALDKYFNLTSANMQLMNGKVSCRGGRAKDSI